MRAKLGDYQGAIADVQKTLQLTQIPLNKIGPVAWPLLFNPSTIYAQAAGKAFQDKRLPEQEREELARKYTQQALQLIGAAIQHAGPQLRPYVLQAIQTDEGLDPIRERPEFKKLF